MSKQPLPAAAPGSTAAPPTQRVRFHERPVRLGLLVALVLALLAGCGGPPPPVWIGAGQQQLESFKRDFLTGAQPLVAELHFKKALDEIKKAGDLDRLGKAWLTRMAFQCCALEPPEDAEYLKIEAAGQVAANHHFYLFLKGDLAAVEAPLLPEPYRASLTALRGGDATEAVKRIAAIEDPLSRLIAASVMVRNHPQNEALLGLAVDTASANGWKRALLAWLKRQAVLSATKGDVARAESIERRIELMQP